MTLVNRDLANVKDVFGHVLEDVSFFSGQKQMQDDRFTIGAPLVGSMMDI